MTASTSAVDRALSALENGDRSGARKILVEATSSTPNDYLAWQLLGRIYYHDGEAEAAIASFRRAIECHTGEADYYSDLGAALRLNKNPEGAILAFRKGIEVDETSVDNHAYLGHVYRETGRYEEAIECYDRAVALSPYDANLHYALGDAHYRLTNLKDSYSCLLRATELNEEFAIAFEYLGTVCKFLGEPQKAIHYYDRAIQLAPRDSLRYMSSTVLPIICDSEEEALHYRHRLMRSIGELLNGGFAIDPLTNNMPVYFFLSYHGENDKDIARTIGKLCRTTKSVPASVLCPRERGRIRVAFVSSHLWNHSVGVLWHGLIGKLDRSRFEVFVFSLAQRTDSVVEYLRSNCENYIELPEDPSSACDVLLSEQLDIIYYIDIGMDSVIYSLAAQRLAPVQCTSWGHPVTTGLANIDYYISSELFEASDADDHYTESLVLLKKLGVYAFRPNVPPVAKSVADFGLPTGFHTYACLQSLFKLDPSFDCVLGEILRNDAKGLLVVPDGHVPEWNSVFLKRFARNNGDVADRVRFIPRLEYDEYMQLVQLAEVLLVPSRFGGGRTSYEAFAAGRPVVTLPSQYLRGRITQGLYKVLGISDCIARDASEFVGLALRIANDAEYRAELRSRISALSHLLFEDLSCVHEVEQFLEQAVSESRNGWANERMP